MRAISDVSSLFRSAAARALATQRVIFKAIFCHFLAINRDLFAINRGIFAVFMDFSCHAAGNNAGVASSIFRNSVAKPAQNQLLT